MGLDYPTLMCKRPIQILPVLYLVSKEREKDKTTFLNWLKAIYQNNMTYNKNKDFRSQFNGDWASKLMLPVDGILLDKVEDNERIKILGTARTFKTDAKQYKQRPLMYKHASMILFVEKSKEQWRFI